MRLAPSALAVLILPLLAVMPACQRHEEAAAAPPPPAAPSTIWSDADSQAIAEQFVASALRDSWSSQFRDRNGRAATIAVGTITDRSGHAVPVDGLGKAIASALGSAGADKLSSGGETSDYVVNGVLGASTGTTADGAAATFFAVDLTVSERASGNAVWLFAVERPVLGN